MNKKQPLKGQVALITGASSGIGAGMAADLARLGAIPILIARSEAKLREVSALVPGEHEIRVMDVTENEQVVRTVEEIAAKFGRIDILINSAGYGIFERFESASLEDLEDMMDVNYMGTVRCIKAVLPHMLGAGRGNIVNIASMAGKIGSAKAGGYSATKHAVLGLTNSLRQEFAGTGVILSAVNPGPIDTPFFDRADPSGSYAANVKWMMLRPEKVSGAVMKAILRGKAEIDLPFVAGFGIKLYGLFPRWIDRLAAPLWNRK